MEYRKQQFLTYDEFTRQFACDYAMPLARGGHGEIYRGVDLETNEEVAIKRRLYSVDDNALTLEKEYAHTQAVPINRFVVRYLYYGRYVTPFGTYEFLVMRFYRDGNLTNTALSWATLSPMQQQRFVSEFLLGLSHLHTHGIVHRDIKPENVLLVRYSDSEGIAFRPVIVDFGISKMMTDYPEAARAFVQNSMRIGTVTYMAPEQLRTENIDYNADLWSFGIILYELITSKHMIARKSFPETQREEAYAFWRMANEERFPDDLRTVPQPYQQIIRKCLIVNSEDRIQSARELIDLLAFQPRIAEAEMAFRRQNWEAVVDALEPIVEQANIPELDVWLQQARMQQAMSEPIDAVSESPSTTPDPVARAVVKGPATNVPEQAPEPPANKPVPYTAQTELLDEPAEPIFARPELPAAILPEPPPTTAVDVANGEPPTAKLDAVADEPQPEETTTDVPVEQHVPSANAPVTDSFSEADVLTDTNVPAEQSIPEPATGELTEAFPEDPAATNNVPDNETHPAETATSEPPETDNVPEQDGGEATENLRPYEPADAEQLTDSESVSEKEEPADGPQYTEAFTDIPNVPAVPPVGREEPELEAEQVPLVMAPPTRKKVRIPTAATKLPPVKMPRLTNPLGTFNADKAKERVEAAYAEAKKVKNRPMVVGSAIAFLLLILFTVGPGQSSDSAVVQLDPNESYAASLKRFKQYTMTYEKTGYLDPYVWAFVHCNPAYDDSLMRLPVRRAEIMLAQHALLYGTYSDDVSGLKRLEMKYMTRDKIRWEIRPHNLSDENCLPKK